MFASKNERRPKEEKKTTSKRNSASTQLHKKKGFPPGVYACQWSINRD